MQEISAFVSGNKFSATATGELTNEYSDESIHVCVLSNLTIKASKLAFWFREIERDFLEKVPPETAFILFDKTTNRTFFGTDAFAVKPLFYSVNSGKLLVHSNLNDLLLFVEERAINSHKIIEYFRWNSDDLPADNKTFYRGIFRLLPGQVGVFENGECSFQQTSLITNNQPFNSFKESFEKAVSIRKANEISAANLSGGLDSSSVVSVLASQLNQKLFTSYFDAQKKEADERKFAEIIAKKYNTIHQEVTAPKSLFESLISLTEKIAQPDPGVLPSFIHEAIFEEVKRTNTKRLFSGHGGDNVVGYGFEYLEGLFRERKWRKFKTEAKKYDDLRQNDESISAGIFKRNIKQFVEKKKFWKAFYLAFICICYFGIIPLPKSLLVSKKLKPQPIDYKHLESSILKLNSDKKTTDSQEFSINNSMVSLTESQQKHVDFCFIRLAIKGNEILTTLGHYRDIAVSFPFFDKQLLNVTTRSSDEETFGNGYLRGTLRNALGGYLPDEIKNRVSKADFTTAALDYFYSLYADFRIAFPLNHSLWKIVDSRIFQELVTLIENDKYSPQQKVKYTWLAMRVINFGVWFEQQNIEHEQYEHFE